MIGRGGFALVYALFLFMALSLVGLGLVAAGTRETMVAEALVRHTRVRLEAEAAALAHVHGWSTRRFDSLAVGARWSLPGLAAWPGVTTSVTRVDSALFLVRSDALESPVGGEPIGSARAAAGLLVRTLRSEVLERAFPAALTVEGAAEAHAGRVSGQDTCRVAVAGVQASVASVAPDVQLLGVPGLRIAPAPPPPIPDPFVEPLASALATAGAPGPAVAPAAGSAGSCTPGPENWGSPDPGHACHDLLPLVHVPGSVRMTGGEGRGILVVDGDARLSGGARFEGIVRVGGRLTVEDGSRIRGAVRAGSALLIDGTIERDGCAMQAALTAPALDRAFRLPGRWWVPQF